MLLYQNINCTPIFTNAKYKCTVYVSDGGKTGTFVPVLLIHQIRAQFTEETLVREELHKKICDFLKQMSDIFKNFLTVATIGNIPQINFLMATTTTTSTTTAGFSLGIGISPEDKLSMPLGTSRAALPCAPARGGGVVILCISLSLYCVLTAS